MLTLWDAREPPRFAENRSNHYSTIRFRSLCLIGKPGLLFVNPGRNVWRTDFTDKLEVLARKASLKPSNLVNNL